jgi:hypothetical protein
VITQHGQERVSTDDAIAAHSTGKKAMWRAPYDALMVNITEFGSDVQAGPAKSYISLLRGEKKFGVVLVSVERLDIGIKLKGAAPIERLEAAGSWNAMITHRVRITDPKQIDNETFDNVQGYYLDKGTSLFETLATISAEEASEPVGGKCATLAAQVKHVAFYLDVLERSVRTQQDERQDWGKIWRETKAVTPEEWDALKTRLRESYDRIKKLISDTTEWPSEQHIGGAIAAIVHTAYHLGEIRQALCSVQAR